MSSHADFVVVHDRDHLGLGRRGNRAAAAEEPESKAHEREPRYAEDTARKAALFVQQRREQTQSGTAREARHRSRRNANGATRVAGLNFKDKYARRFSVRQSPLGARAAADAAELCLCSARSIPGSNRQGAGERQALCRAYLA